MVCIYANITLYKILSLILKNSSLSLRTVFFSSPIGSGTGKLFKFLGLYLLNCSIVSLIISPPQVRFQLMFEHEYFVSLITEKLTCFIVTSYI